MSDRRSHRGIFFLFWLGAVVFVNPLGDVMCDSSFATSVNVVDSRTMELSPHSAMDLSKVGGKYYCGSAPVSWVLPIPLYLALKPFLGVLPDPPGSIASPDLKAHSLLMPYLLPKGVFYLRFLSVWLLMGPLLGLFAEGLAKYAAAHARDKRMAALLPFACAMGTLTFAYATEYSRACLAGLMVWVALLRLLDGGVRGRAGAFVLGVVFGAAVGVDYQAVLLAGPTSLFALSLLDRAGRVALLAGLASVAAALAAFHTVLYGGPFLTPYHFRVWPEYLRPIYKGELIHLDAYLKGPLLGLTGPTWASLFGLTLSPFKGVFVYCPALLPGFYGHYRAWSRRQWRPLAVCATATFLACLLFNASLGGEPFWSGGPVYWGPRYMIAGLPLVVLGIMHLELTSWRKPAVCAAVAVSCGIGLLGAMFRNDLMKGVPETMQSAIPAFAETFATQGPRVPLLALYGTAEWVQWLVFAAYAALAAAAFRAEWGGRRRQKSG